MTFLMEEEPVIRGPTLKALAVIPLPPNSYIFQVISQAAVDTGISVSFTGVVSVFINIQRGRGAAYRHMFRPLAQHKEDPSLSSCSSK